MSKSFRRYLAVVGRTIGSRPQKQTRRFLLERLEDRINPSVTASVVAGVLTVTSDAISDDILVADIDADGSVDVDDLGTEGTDFANLGDITSLSGISVVAGDGADTITFSGTDSLGNVDLAGVSHTVSGGAGSDRIDASDMTAAGLLLGD